MRSTLHILVLAALSAPVTAQCDVQELLVPAPTQGFGSALDLAGDLLVVGAPLDDASGTDAGAAYVYQRSGSTWSPLARLEPDDPAPDKLFGAAVATSGSRVVVGASGDDALGTRAGAAYVFEEVGGIWTQVQKLTGSSSGAFHLFGFSLALDQGRLVVGAPQEEPAGPHHSVYVFERSPSGWDEVQRITVNFAPDARDFGHCVALSGNALLVGAPSVNSGVPPGAVYVFRESAGTWVEEDVFVGTWSNDRFGAAVAIDGELAVIGAPEEDFRGTVFAYAHEGSTWREIEELPPPVATLSYGLSIGLSSEFLLVGSTPGQGQESRGYLFRRGRGRWVPYVHLISPAGGARFARAVAVDGARAVVGDDHTLGVGAAFAFEGLAECFVPVELGDIFCGPANLNSTGGRATIAAAGHPVASLSVLTLSASQMPAQQFGYFLAADDTTILPGAGGSQGVLCLAGTIARFATTPLTTGANGAFQLEVDLTALPTTPPQPALAGETWNFQAWYRDSNPRPTSNFTDAVAIEFQ
ncbi:MAG: hypothetical protein GY711_07210 [bacterium]|nr:hypothetical protein [bacterium]